MEKKYIPSPISNSLGDISMIMSDGYNFVILRHVAEQWAKEAKEGNKNSQALIDIITKFEKLVKITIKKADA
jgi:hypothetical protein